MLRFLGPLVRRSCGPCKVGLRSFAEASAAMQSAPARIPSVPTHGTYGRYALALYMAGQKAGKLDVIDKDLQQVCEGCCKWVTCAALDRLSTSKSVQVWKLASESEEFAQFLRDPSVPKKQKSKVLQDVLSDVKVSELTKNFFRAPLLSCASRDRTRAANFASHPTVSMRLPANVQSACAQAAVVLAENNRLNLYDKIVSTFGELMAAARGQVTCTITSAEVLAQLSLYAR